MRCLTAGSLQGVAGPHWATAGLTTVDLSRCDEPVPHTSGQGERVRSGPRVYRERGGPSLGYASDSKDEVAAPTHRRSPTMPAVTHHTGGHGLAPIFTHSFGTWWCPQTHLLKTSHTGSGVSKAPLRSRTAALM